MVQSSDTELETYFSELKLIHEQSDSEQALFKNIVNAPFHNRKHTGLLGLGIIVLLLVNKKAGTIDRVALADTDMAQGTVDISAKRFEDIKIPVDNKKNIIARAIREGRHTITDDWQYLFTPDLTPQEARFNQAGGGIGCSVVYPLKNVKDGGALIFSYFEPIGSIDAEHHKFMQRYAAMVSGALSKI